jgi:hypothetical protein
VDFNNYSPRVDSGTGNPPSAAILTATAGSSFIYCP